MDPGETWVDLDHAEALRDDANRTWWRGHNQFRTRDPYASMGAVEKSEVEAHTTRYNARRVRQEEMARRSRNYDLLLLALFEIIRGKDKSAVELHRMATVAYAKVVR